MTDTTTTTTTFPTIGRIGLFRTDGRNGMVYDLPAIVTCTRDTHPGDYPDGAPNPLPVPDEGHVHLTVFSPGGFGTEILTNDDSLDPNDMASYKMGGKLLPGAGTYVEWNVEVDNDPESGIFPRTWRFPPRV